MITTRERVRLSELAAGLLKGWGPDTSALFDGLLPLDVRHCTFTNQGKAAFEQIVLAAGLQRSRVIMPAFFPDDFVGVFRRYEITPVFVDVHPDSYHLDLGAISERHLAGAKALILLHTFGLPADGRAVRAFCDEHGLIMIEDCARALGASSAGELVGSFGHYALFSLPKCTPVRQGGILLSERPLRPHLLPAHIGVSGLLHALTLVRFPLVSLVEGWAYRRLADTPVYPREVGNYDTPPGRELDRLGKVVLAGFMPHYRQALARKRECACRIRGALEPEGFTFQRDEGEHIYTALSVDPPEGCDADGLQAHLLEHGIKASAMWRGALGLSQLAREEWQADPSGTPEALRLAARLIQLPVSRFHSPEQSDQVIRVCHGYASGERTRVGG